MAEILPCRRCGAPADFEAQLKFMQIMVAALEREVTALKAGKNAEKNATEASPKETPDYSEAVAPEAAEAANA